MEMVMVASLSSPAAPKVSDRLGSYHVHGPATAAYWLSPMERSQRVKQGVPAREVVTLADAMGLPRDQFMRVLGLARSTVNEPKTEDTDRILAAGLRLAADPEAAESALLRMTDIVEAEKHRVAPNCAACAMPCGNTSNYDLARLWGAPAEICALKVRLLSAVCVLAGQKTTAQIQKEICDDLFVLAEDWDTELLLPIVTRAEGLCVQ